MKLKKTGVLALLSLLVSGPTFAVTATNYEIRMPAGAGAQISWSLDSAVLPIAALNSAYTYDFNSVISSAPANHAFEGIEWSMTGSNGSLSLNTTTGVLSGTPTTTGNTSLVVSANYNNNNKSQSYTLSVEGTVASAPSLSTATAKAGAVDLYWALPTSNGGSAISNIKVYRGTSTNPTALLTTLAGNASFFADTGLPNGVTYYYRVVATNAAGDSPFSATRSAKTFPFETLTTTWKDVTSNYYWMPSNPDTYYSGSVWYRPLNSSNYYAQARVKPAVVWDTSYEIETRTTGQVFGSASNFSTGCKTAAGLGTYCRLGVYSNGNGVLSSVTSSAFTKLGAVKVRALGVQPGDSLAGLYFGSLVDGYVPTVVKVTKIEMRRKP